VFDGVDDVPLGVVDAWFGVPVDVEPVDGWWAEPGVGCVCGGELE
jgi:hypothetical protein